METTRQAHEDKMKAQLDDWRARIDSLKTNAAKAETGAKVELEKVLGELRDLEASAKKHFDELAAASVENWSVVKTALDDTWAKVSSAVDATWARWRDRTEPSKHEHKKQLHDRVIERGNELKAMLAGFKSDPQSAKSERAVAIEAALAALETHLGGGWDVIDESESAALTRWLESSRFLFDGKPVETTFPDERQQF
jgi:gas vesicle protein